MGLASQLEEATRRKPKRSRKPKKSSPGGQLLLAAAERANAQVGDPDVLDSMIRSVLVDRVQALLEKLYSKARRFKTTRTDEVSDDEAVNYGTYDNPDEVIYFARCEYPAEVTSTVTASLKPALFSKDLARELEHDAEVSPSSAAKKIASDREVLVFAGKQALESVMKAWAKDYGDPPDEDSDIAKQAKAFAERDADDVRMSADPKQTEISHVADLELEVRDVKSRLSFASPWKFKVDTTFNIRADFEWDDYS